MMSFGTFDFLPIFAKPNVRCIRLRSFAVKEASLIKRPTEEELTSKLSPEQLSEWVRILKEDK